MTRWIVSLNSGDPAAHSLLRQIMGIFGPLPPPVVLAVLSRRPPDYTPAGRSSVRVTDVRQAGRGLINAVLLTANVGESLAHSPMGILGTMATGMPLPRSMSHESGGVSVPSNTLSMRATISRCRGSSFFCCRYCCPGSIFWPHRWSLAMLCLVYFVVLFCLGLEQGGSNGVGRHQEANRLSRCRSLGVDRVGDGLHTNRST